MSDELRQKLLDTPLQQGFAILGNRLVLDNIRQLYAHLRLEKLKEARFWLLANEEKIPSYLASGSEVDVGRIYPKLELVDTQHKADLFRYASLLSSVPVSAGYGRRMHFLFLTSIL